MTRDEWEEIAKSEQRKADEARAEGDEERAEFYDRKQRAALATMAYGTVNDDAGESGD